MCAVKGFIAALYIFYLQFVIAGAPVLPDEFKAPKVGEAVNYRSIMFRNAPLIPRKGFDECKDFERRQIVGFTLAGIGGASIVAGGYMTYIGIRNIVNDVSNSASANDNGTVTVGHKDIGLAAGGAILTIAGLILTPTGLAVGIRGSILRRRYCGGGNRSSLYIRPSQKGVGLACTF